VAKTVKALFKSACRFGGGGYGKNTARIGVKIPSATCGPKIRDDLFVSRTLRVLVSLDPKTDDQPVLPGMQDEFPVVELTVKVSQHSLNDSDVTFSMTFGKEDMPASFLQTVSHANGSLYVLSVIDSDDADDEPDDEPDDDDEHEED
jgi:hypothetical protein